MSKFTCWEKGVDISKLGVYTSIMEMEKDRRQFDVAAIRQLAATCACMHIRKAARVITQFYDAFVQPTGLRMTQFIILAAVALSEQDTVMQLAEKLAMDRSALAHTLKALQEQGLLTVEPGSDRRTRLVRLTRQGREAVSQTLPYWRQAQEQLVMHLGEQPARLLLADLKRVEELYTSLELPT
jgi:DNA-binding MarR family transcriptional regulator